MRESDLVSRLQDMLDSIADIEAFTAGSSFDDYARDSRLRRATERCIEIISEASRHVPDALKNHHPTIPWR